MVTIRSRPVPANFTLFQYCAQHPKSQNSDEFLCFLSLTSYKNKLRRYKKKIVRSTFHVWFYPALMHLKSGVW